MAILIVCAVRDSAVDHFGQPIFVRALGEATRSFVDEINRAGSAFNAHPSDYELFHLGTYNDEDGSFVARNPASIITGKAALNAKE